jgi:hypothetical protein
MNTGLLPLVGLFLGGVVAWWAWAILFTTPLTRIFPLALIPIGLAAATSFLLVWLEPKKWKLLAASVALPISLLATLLIILLWMEGRNGWVWLLVAGTAIGVCAISSWLAYAQKTKRP